MNAEALLFLLLFVAWFVTACFALWWRGKLLQCERELSTLSEVKAHGEYWFGECLRTWIRTDRENKRHEEQLRATDATYRESLAREREKVATLEHNFKILAASAAQDQARAREAEDRAQRYRAALSARADEHEELSMQVYGSGGWKERAEKAEAEGVDLRTKLAGMRRGPEFYAYRKGLISNDRLEGMLDETRWWKVPGDEIYEVVRELREARYKLAKFERRQGANGRFVRKEGA